jgi:hypothetical protein
MQICDLDQIGFFTLEQMCKDQQLETFLLSDGSVLVLPPDAARMIIDRPDEKLPTYSRSKIQKMINVMMANAFRKSL